MASGTSPSTSVQDLTLLPAHTATERIQQGHLTVSELCEAFLARAKARSEIGAWTHLDASQVMQEAEKLDEIPLQNRKSPFFGATVAIKDIIHTRDMPTRFGSERYTDYNVAFDASVVQILRRAGCVVMGKTVTTELAFTMTGKHTLNPRNTELSPGGSSSGSAAAVADNQVQIAVGTQTFGSVTRPASYCGIFGWKPTWGLISTVGGKFCSPTLDTIGFFARDVQDLQNLATVFNAEKNEAIPTSPAEWKVGVMIPLGWEHASEDAKAVLKQAEDILKNAGASTETFELPASFEKVLAHQRVVAVKELATSWLTEGDIKDSDDVMIRTFYEEGKNTPYPDYLEALDNLANLRREFDELASKYTFIISLSATGQAPTGLTYTGDSRYNTMSTALHFPVVNVPGLNSKEGNPIGISVMAGRGRDMQVLEASAGLSALIHGLCLVKLRGPSIGATAHLSRVADKVSLDLDLSGNASGYTELSVTPTDAGLKTIFLHSRECRIKSVSINSTTECQFHLAAPLTTAITTPSGANNIRSTYPELKRRLYQAANEAEEGELAVVLPAGVVKKANQRSTESVAPQPNGADGAASPDPGAKSSKEPEFEPIQITIEYDLRNPKDGIHVVKPSDLYPNRIPHCYTSSDTVDAARCWVPCVDGLWERCSWELVFSVPRVLSYEQETEQGIEVEEFPIVVVASGELVEQIVHPHSPNKTIFHYEQAVPTTVQHIGFAYGPFSIVDLSPSAQNAQQEQDGDEVYPEEEEAIAAAADAEGQVQMHAFCLPGREEDLLNSVSFMTRALEFNLEEFGSYPFNSFKMIFVDDCPFSMFNTAGLGIFSAEMLFPPSIIDQAYETRQALTYSLTSQWVGINIIQKTWADTWVIQGLSIYVNGLCLRKLMGNNEYRFRLKKDVARCCAWDVKMPPLCQPGVMSPPSSDILPFINLKSPLVLHILDRQLLKAGTHNGLSRIIPKLYLSAISGDLKENLLSTHNFLRMCRKVSGADLRHFADQWIYAAGCPRFHIAANFNRKRMAVELAIKQESPAAQYAEQAEWSEKVNLRPINIFEGQMTVRIHEADGTPYEHVINIGEMYKKHEVSFNTKYKRIRRSTKRFQARKAAEEAAAAGDVEAIEAVGNIDTSFTLPLWEDSKDPATGKRRESWKVADWSEEDEKAQEQAVYEWIRIDTEFEWIAVISFEQPDFMWLSQLQRDRDVIAQLEAVHALARMPSPIVSSNLAKTVLVSNYFYRIRMEAALALVASASRNLDYLGLFYLFKIFQTRYCFEPEKETTDPFAFRCVPRPNDFVDFAEYHIRKSIIIAISHVRDERGNPFQQVQRFLVDLLTYNDNATNPYSDAFYITTVIAALGNPFVSLSQQQSDFATPGLLDSDSEHSILSAALDEVIRYANLDRLVPSYHNVITVATVEWRVKMMMASLIPLDLKTLLAYTREGNYPAVRSAAFDGLLLLRALQEKVISRYIFAVLRYDSCRLVQRRLAQSLVENLPILAAMDDLAGQDAGYVEEDAKVLQKSSHQSVESMLKALRNSVGRSIMLRDSMMAVILAPSTHLEIRWCLLKLCEVLIKPSEEPLPKIKLKMPSLLRLSSTTTLASTDLPLSTSAPSALPKIKLGSTDVVRREASVDPQAAVSQPIKLVLGNKKIKLSKEQKSGMSLQDLKVCQNLLQKLTATKKADLFRRPVDPIRDGAPSYFEHIKQPMDLSTMSHKLNAGLYKDRFAFRDDFKLMISNCYIFNGTESLPGKLAHTFDVYFDKQWERANATLEQLRLRAGVPATEEPLPAVNGHTEAPQTVPQQPPAVEEHFVAPQPPAAPVAAAPPIPAAPRPSFNLKLKLSTSSAPKHVSPPQPTPPVVEASPADPTKPSDTRQPSVGPAASPRETPRLPSVSREMSRGPSMSRDSRSSSPAVPLAVAAPAAVSKPKFKFTTKPKPEPVDDEFIAPLPPSRPSPQQSPAPRASVEPVQSKPKKIRLSIGGHGASSSQSPAPLPTPTPPPVTSAPATNGSHGRNGSHSEPRPPAQSAAAGGEGHFPVNVKKMSALLKKIISMDESYFFRRPVDPIADGCPTYYQEVQHPMDLGTMQVKLNNGAYHYQSEINEDFDQIVTNCKIFNPPGTLPIAHAESLQKFYWSEVSKLGKLSYQEKRALQGMMNRLRQKPYAGIFLEAVDPEALGIPMYFQIIPKQDARDLSLIKRKLDNDEYTSFDAFEADFRLMLNNCYIFNGETSAAGEVGKMLESEFDREFETIKNQMPGASSSSNNKSVKRGSTGPPGGGSTIKKIRLSTG